MQKFIFLFALICFSVNSIAQTDMKQSDEDIFFIKSIYKDVLTESRSYEWLKHLCLDIGARKSGSEAYKKAVRYALETLSPFADTVYTIESNDVMLWERGDSTSVHMITEGMSVELNSIALGNSVSSPAEGIEAEVIEVHSIDEVKELAEEVSGKIVFYNRPFDNTLFSQGAAYGGAVDQRVYGATTAAEFGAIGVIVRSMTGKIDDVPHTGTNAYRDEFPKIPAIAISTLAAEKLSKTIRTTSSTKVKLFTNAHPVGRTTDETVIAEIKGFVSPDTILLVGGHLDSWDVGQGAHDDGAGAAHAVGSFVTLAEMGYKPRYTVRCVLFANEESGLAGGRKYAELSNENNEYHLAAIESDNGGFSPRGFSCQAEASVYRKLFAGLAQHRDILEPYGLYITNGWSGADIAPLKAQKGLLIGFNVDIHRYFDLHHTEEDTFDKVHKRELEMGTASVASMLYLIDKHGL